MRYLLLGFCFSGLAYCIIQILAIIFEFVHYYRMFKYISVSFNVQYQVLREYIKGEETSEDIIRGISTKDPEDLDVVAFKNHITVLYVKGASFKCANSAEIRNAFLKSGTLMQKLREYFKLHNVVFVEGIYDENQEFFEELQRVRQSKGEPTEIDLEEELKNLEEEENE